MRVRSWLYRWLPIVFGCHCREDRSFHIRGARLPLCARCTGELVGILLCLLSAPFFLPPVPLALGLLVPMVLDGGLQALTPYESGNLRRLVTGLLFGYGLAALFLESTTWAFRQGMELGRSLTASM